MPSTRIRVLAPQVWRCSQIGNQSQGYREPDYGRSSFIISSVSSEGECGITAPSGYLFGESLLSFLLLLACSETTTIPPVTSSASSCLVETLLFASPTEIVVPWFPIRVSILIFPDRDPPPQDPYVATVCSLERACNNMSITINKKVFLLSLLPAPPGIRPSRKRCRSPVDSVPSSMPVTGSLAPTRADHLPPLLGWDEVGDHVGTDHRDARVDTEEYEADASTEVVRLEARDGVDRIVEIETAQGRLEADQLIASGDRAKMAEAIYSLGLENLKNNDKHSPLESTLLQLKEMIDQRCTQQVEAHQVNQNLELGNNNGNNNGNGNGNDNGNGERGGEDFMKCQPTNFKGTEGVVGLIRWSVQLSLWNSHKITIGTDAAYAFVHGERADMRQIYFSEVCIAPRLMEIPKDETELWNLTYKSTRCLFDANNLKDPKLKVMLEKCGEQDDNGQHLMDKQPWATSHLTNNIILGDRMLLEPMWQVTSPNEEKKYAKCNRVGHLARNCRVTNPTTPTQRGQIVNPKVVTCFEYGAQGHYRNDCPKIKNRNRGNKARVPDASGRAYALGGGDVNPGSNTVTGTFLLNDHHAYMLFDSGADRSFISNTFSAMLDITPYALDVSYAVELADGRTSETNTVFMGCTLGLLGHPFNIDLMPIELGSFDVIIGMDWLAKNHAVIVCDEKIVRIPYGNEILIVQGDLSSFMCLLTTL
ncbi:putative reverse transcriptase domain-containing protein [Tanacetum coccineum]